MVFAPEQFPEAHKSMLPSYPFHAVPIPDARHEDGRKTNEPITLGQWCDAVAELQVTISEDRRHATFEFNFMRMIPNSLYTIMSLRRFDLNPLSPTRPGPLGIPNVFITDKNGNSSYHATLPNPFPEADKDNGNRIINVVVLWMSRSKKHTSE